MRFAHEVLQNRRDRFLDRSTWTPLQLAAVVSYVAGIGAARRLGARLASFIGMAELLFTVLFAWLLLGQLPSAIQFLGGAFILAGVTLVRADELRPAQAPGPPGRTPDTPMPQAVRRHAGQS